eukprot:2338-Heterococcus_DN1.PRE.5
MVLKSKLLQQCNISRADDAASSQRKRQCVAGSISYDVVSALDKDEILDQVFSYVGGGDHLYVAGVSRRWRGSYMQHCAQTTTSAQDTKCVTRCRSIIMSESRLQHAKFNEFVVADLDITKSRHAAMICEYSLEPERVVAALRLRGAPWDSMSCRYAAFSGRLSILQWLHRKECQWDEYNVLLNASRGGSVPMIVWLKSVTEPWSKGTLVSMLIEAASCDKLAAAQWLRANGAAWPTKFASEYTTNAKTSKQCWSLSVLQWAIASSSGWLNWKCDEYDANNGIPAEASDHLRQYFVTTLTDDFA